MTNGAFQSSQSSQSSQYNEKHGRKLILEVRREGTIDEEAISVLSVLRGVISKLRRLQFLFFFCIPFFALNSGVGDVSMVPRYRPKRPPREVNRHGWWECV